MEAPYRKDLGHLGWEQVFARQAQRAGLIDAWIDALDLEAGDRVLDVGAGPGFVSLALAERVGPGGTVYAVDRSADALAHLERLQGARGIGQIARITGDAAALDPACIRPDAALVTMVLHHADDPAAILRSVARSLPPGAPVVIGEFHPDGPCTGGPPRAERLAPAQVRAWCEQAGLDVTAYRRQTPEHYALVAKRGAPCA
jgi:ubiquinone/menaquinone biosynthesis C-methylase UbiE